MLTVTHWVLSLAPLGVLGLVTTAVAATGGSVFMLLGKHFFTVLLGLALHAFVILPTIVWIFTRITPRRLFQIVSEAMLTAFTTSSSSATIAVNLRNAIEKGGVSPRVASFVIPLGATINMDGTALYECAAVMFIAQVLGFPLDVWSQFTIVLLACLTSVGVAGVPAASLVAVVLIINSLGIPGANAAIGFIYAVDRLLDMSRTSVNVMSDACGALVVARLEEDSQKSPA
jgi:Na+/H+-dicarboxylate symporter